MGPNYDGTKLDCVKNDSFIWYISKLNGTSQNMLTVCRGYGEHFDLLIKERQS